MSNVPLLLASEAMGLTKSAVYKMVKDGEMDHEVGIGSNGRPVFLVSSSDVLKRATDRLSEKESEVDSMRNGIEKIRRRIGSEKLNSPIGHPLP